MGSSAAALATSGNVIDDGALVARIRAGDEAAFSKLYRRYSRHIAAVVYRLMGNDSHLDDIVQETFVIGAKQLSELREPKALRGWLTTIAVRRVKRHLASCYRRKELSSALDAVTVRVSEPSAGEEVHALYRALARLPEKQRAAWTLHHLEGETLPVVAELCETSLSSVKRHIAAATKSLRRSYDAG